MSLAARGRYNPALPAPPLRLNSPFRPFERIPASSGGVVMPGTMRVGIGYDSHRLTTGRPLVLGGIRIEHPQGLAGHSDADVVLHAVTDALLGAAGLGDIGDTYPDTDPALRDANSSRFVSETLELLHKAGWRIANMDVTIFAERPKLGQVKSQIRRNLSLLLAIESEAVNVKAKTGEGVGTIGRGEVIACQAVALIERAVARSHEAPVSSQR